jgi:hypothetical protein
MLTPFRAATPQVMVRLCVERPPERRERLIDFLGCPAPRARLHGDTQVQDVLDAARAVTL